MGHHESTLRTAPVFLGITMFQGSGLDVLRHAFACGVWLAEMRQSRIQHHAATLALHACARRPNLDLCSVAF